MESVVGILEKALMITAFVSVMMLVVEYLNVRTRGILLQAIHGSRWRQYLLAAILGAIPGCLGAYAVVALFAHRKMTLGALVTAMIATSGDETFVMLALFPSTALLLTGGLACTGLVSGWATDKLAPRSWISVADECCELDIHDEDDCNCFPRGEILKQWSPPSPYRATMVLGLALALFALVTGHMGPASWGWKRITLAIVMATGLFVSSTVPEHFLEEHLWRHVALRHVPRVFMWTVGALAILAALAHFVDLHSLVAQNRFGSLITASLVGVLPESGPHLVFVTMFDEGAIPLSVLAASSIVQDGHGMLPLLSASKRAFVLVKLVNLIAGIAVGFVLLSFGM